MTSKEAETLLIHLKSEEIYMRYATEAVPQDDDLYIELSEMRGRLDTIRAGLKAGFYTRDEPPAPAAPMSKPPTAPANGGFSMVFGRYGVMDAVGPFVLTKDSYEIRSVFHCMDCERLLNVGDTIARKAGEQSTVYVVHFPNCVAGSKK